MNSTFLCKNGRQVGALWKIDVECPNCAHEAAKDFTAGAVMATHGVHTPSGENKTTRWNIVECAILSRHEVSVTLGEAK